MENCFRFYTSKIGYFGKAYFGGKGVFPTGGINSEGLWFEYHQGEFPKQMDNTKGKIIFKGNLIDKIMSECITIQNVTDTLKKYTQFFFFNQNIAFGDKFGSSIIIEGDTIITRKGDYQICTNFYQSVHDRSNAPCWRYRNVEETLKRNTNLLIKLIKEALSSAQNPVFTQYSVIYDLKKGVIYLYFFRDYNNQKIFILKDEFQKGEHFYLLPDLFSNNKAYNDIYIKRQVPQNNWLIRIFLGLFGISPLISYIVMFMMRVPKTDNKITKRIAFITKLSLGLAPAVSLIDLLRFLSYPESFQIGILPPAMRYYSQTAKIILHIPKLLILIGIVMILVSIIHWRKRIFNLFSRIYFSIYSGLLIILIFLFAYWGFIIPY
ncbi:C45 family peptidase [Maribellus maritimus]|uniref:hypothetical protein n=1 Tax=Maribellus maritimus TaxID=2870838 RepID=UPI001EEB4FA0|nr:hypothetical protein [Maribellus maritimus]MCG6191427.1 hypothetical protein [Maribellus maritimus]